MRRVPITQHASLANGRVAEFAGERDYLATGSVSDDGVFRPKIVDYASRPSRADLVAKPGDVCFARMQGTKKVFEASAATGDPILSTGFAVLRPDPKHIDSGFLRCWVDSEEFQSVKDRLCTGATQKAITNAKIKTLSLFLPPLVEQKRIADILDAADALRAKRRESLAQLDTLLQSAFVDMFGDPVTNPMGWHLEPLGEILNPKRPISYGILKPGDYEEDGVIMLRIQDIREGGVRDNDLHRVPEELSAQYKRTLLSGNEVVISLVGTIGLCALIPRRFAGANVHRNLAVVVAGESVEPVFLHQYMVSENFQFRVRETTKGGIQKLLNLGDLKRLTVPVPPIDMQHRFAAIVESVEQQKASQRTHLAELDALFASLQQRVFNGSLAA